MDVVATLAGRLDGSSLHALASVATRNNTIYQRGIIMPTKSLPSIAMRYSVIAILLLIPVGALPADDGRPPISDNFAIFHQPSGKG